MLDLTRLAMLREFAVRGTLAATAEAMGYTPSAISQQLAVLEREAVRPSPSTHPCRGTARGPRQRCSRHP